MMVWQLTWRGRADAVGYRLRRLFVAPAEQQDRCFMGSVVDPMVHCPRRAVPDSPWCPVHGGRDD